MPSPLKKLFLTLFLLTFTLYGYAQRNLSGKKGLIYVPSAEESQDGEWSVGYIYNPIDYSLRGNGVWAEQILFTNINLLPRFQVSFLLLQQRRDGKRKERDGIGDRQLDLRYQIIRETKKKPALALLMSSPFTIDAALQTHVLVASKTFKKNHFNITPSLGFGSPYYFYRAEDNLNNGNIFSELTLQKKSEDNFNNKYLVGLFGGLKCSLYENYHLLAEWDGQKVNAGISATFFKKLNAQVSLLNFDQVSFGFSYATNLKTRP
ncbi:YjbH domain-containing protein [uncultured Arcticibacterium sp.]|uniref:YjbH domain-containing protein n=1 Tax=uncultured Arcticibacterium sp. TaxID=2173042 RepID=UPI0030FC584B